MKPSELTLSLDSDTFEMMKTQLSDMIQATLMNMELKKAPDASITMKLSIHLEKAKKAIGDNLLDVVIPSFKHDISSVMQVKQKTNGELTGDYVLVFDMEKGEYVMQENDDGQISFYEAEDEPSGIFTDYDYEEPDEE